MNGVKTAFLLTLMTLLAIGVGDYFGGRNGMVLAFGLAAITNFVSYFFSDKIALAMYRADAGDARTAAAGIFRGGKTYAKDRPPDAENLCDT